MVSQLSDVAAIRVISLATIVPSDCQRFGSRGVRPQYDQTALFVLSLLLLPRHGDARFRMLTPSVFSTASCVVARLEHSRVGGAKFISSVRLQLAVAKEVVFQFDRQLERR
jgi:hypothetical protein